MANISNFLTQILSSQLTEDPTVIERGKSTTNSLSNKLFKIVPANIGNKYQLPYTYAYNDAGEYINKKKYRTVNPVLYLPLEGLNYSADILPTDIRNYATDYIPFKFLLKKEVKKQTVKLIREIVTNYSKDGLTNITEKTLKKMWD